MPCHVDPPELSYEEYLEDMLCKACKFLTKKQMESIKDYDLYMGLIDWYKEHLLHDFSKNYYNNDPTEKNICLEEAKRLGWVLKKESDTSFSIDSLYR